MKKYLLYALTICIVATAVCSCENEPETGGKIEAETYAVSISSNNSEWGSATFTIDDVADTARSEAGKIVRITATAEYGYKFVRWEVAGDIVELENKASTAFTMPVGPVTITAIFQEDSAVPRYAVHISQVIYNATVTVFVYGMSADRVLAGSTVELSIEVEEGYDLLQWMLLATGSGDDLSDLLEDKTAFTTSFVMPAREVTVAADVIEQSSFTR